MKATQKLHDLGQSLWLDNITRGLLTKGTLRRYIDELSVTGLTSNPTNYEHAIKNTDFYDNAIWQIEARLEGRQPIVAIDHAATLNQAFYSAIDKLLNMIESILGRQSDKRSHDSKQSTLELKFPEEE